MTELQRELESAREMARCNVKMTPLGTDAKPGLLRKLQGSIYFEKSLSASAVAPHNGKFSANLTVPASFVRSHGDKFRKSVKLRTDPSPVAWLVNLQVWYYSPTSSQVRFSGGWRAFANAHFLLEGDELVFALTAMSEFEVYIFRSKERPPKNSFLGQTSKHTCVSDCSVQKAKKVDAECTDECLSGDENGSVEDSNSWMIESKKSGAARDSPESSSSCTKDGLDHLHGFVKTLTITNITKQRGATLELPRGFCKMYGHRIHSVVMLQGIYEQSPVRTMPCTTSLGKNIRHYLRGEWRAFVAENQLHVGQQLLFTLSADSSFVVRDRRAQKRT